MPAAIPIAATFAASWGSSAFLGTALGGAMAGAIGSFATGAIAGAVIGATVSGLGAAVTGGDIGKGMLFGAIGGAVGGGIAGYMDAGSFTGMGKTAAGVKYGDLPAVADSGKLAGADAMYSTGAEATKTVAEETGKGLLASMSDEAQGALVEGGIGMLGDTLSGIGAQKQAESQQEWDAEQAQLNRDHEMAKLQASLKGGGGGGSGRDWAAELAENRRQFNAELAQRQHEFSSDLQQRRKEFERPFQEAEKDRLRSASAVASVDLKRGGQVKAPSVYEQVTQEANKVNPEEVTA